MNALFASDGLFAGPGRASATPRPLVTGPTLFGLAVFGLFFVAFGTWATTAPLSSAAIGTGLVIVDTNRKVVQHLEGGIIAEILVRDGQDVEADQPLVRLDVTQAETAWQVERSQLDTLLAQKARLLAERDGLERIAFPAELERKRGASPEIRESLDGQEKIFQSQRAVLTTQIDILNEQIRVFAAEIDGLKAQKRSAVERLASFNAELKDVQTLTAAGLERKARKLALERDAATLTGTLAEHDSRMAVLERRVAEARLQITEKQNAYVKQAATELRETETKIEAAAERLRAAQDVLVRRDVVAPVSGTVANLQYHTPGGVIAPGSAILDIVPQDERLIIQAQIKPVDIDEVYAGLPAKVRLTAFNQRSTPTVDGTVAQVAADVTTEQNSGLSYYVARVTVDERELSKLHGIHLYLGMPAEVLVVTGDRTLVDYLLKPITQSMARAFRES